MLTIDGRHQGIVANAKESLHSKQGRQDADAEEVTVSLTACMASTQVMANVSMCFAFLY